MGRTGKKNLEKHLFFKPCLKINFCNHQRLRTSMPLGRVKKICFHIFFCSHKFHKVKNYFIFKLVKKKIWANLQRIMELFTQKIVIKLSKIWFWDPGSEIWDPEKTYSGSRIQRSKRHWIRIRNTAWELWSSASLAAQPLSDSKYASSRTSHRIQSTACFSTWGWNNKGLY